MSGGCTGTLEVFDDEQCGGSPSTLGASCSTVAGRDLGETVGMAARFTPTAVTATCPGSTGGLNGDVAGAEPTTVCCLP